jgi:hypothetical protein
MWSRMLYVRGSFDNQERVPAKKSLLNGGTAGVAIYLFSVSIVLVSALPSSSHSTLSLCFSTRVYTAEIRPLFAK